MKAKMILGTLLLAATWGYCEGSLGTSEILYLLNSKPKVAEFIQNALELSEGALGARLGNHWEELGAERIGPYSILAKPKGAKDWTMEVHLCTRTTFIDAKGNAIKTIGEAIKKAVSFKEELLTVQFEELHSGRPYCPEE